MLNGRPGFGVLNAVVDFLDRRGRFAGRAGAAQPAMAKRSRGARVGTGWAAAGGFGLANERGRIVGVELVADPARLGGLDLTLLDAGDETPETKHRRRHNGGETRKAPSRRVTPGARAGCSG